MGHTVSFALGSYFVEIALECRSITMNTISAAAEYRIYAMMAATKRRNICAMARIDCNLTN